MLLNTDILRGHIIEGAQFGKLISMRSQLKTMNPDQSIEAKVIKREFLYSICSKYSLECPLAHANRSSCSSSQCIPTRQPDDLYATHRNNRQWSSQLYRSSYYTWMASSFYEQFEHHHHHRETLS